jgi:hypothetical protein
MIDRGLYRKNFSVGGRDGPASGDAPGPGDTGGAGGYEKGFTDQFGDRGSSPTSTGGITDVDRNRVKQEILNQKVIGINKLNPNFFDKFAGIPNAFRTLSLKNLYDQKMGLKNISPSIFGTIANITNPQLNVYSKTDPDLDMYGMTGEDLTDIDRLADAINTSELYGGITQSDFEKAFYGPEGKPDLTGNRDGGGITTLPYVPTTIQQQVEETIPVEQSSFYQMLRRNLGLV